jgi:hypothetical protein
MFKDGGWGKKSLQNFFLVKNVDGSRFGKWAENLVYFVAFFWEKNPFLNFHFFLKDQWWLALW